MWLPDDVREMLIGVITKRQDHGLVAVPALEGHAAKWAIIDFDSHAAVGFADLQEEALQPSCCLLKRSAKAFPLCGVNRRHEELLAALADTAGTKLRRRPRQRRELQPPRTNASLRG